MAEPTKPVEGKSEKSGKGTKPDLASIAGIFVAFGGILGGLIIEGGKIKDVSQFTAAMIVLGGTTGAVMVSLPLRTLMGGLKRLGGVFLDKKVEIDGMIDEVIGYATKARKNGLVSLEQEAFAIEDPFLKKALTLAVDGTDLQEMRKMLELQIDLEEQHAEAEAKVFEYAGGYAPTVGIIGAVMGLIQVMKNLANIEEVGHGIAVAFVATVYGVASANIFFLPAGAKIKARVHKVIQNRELMLEGVVGIVEGLNPKLIRSKLEAYEGQAPAKKEAKAPKSAKAPAQAAAAEG